MNPNRYNKYMSSNSEPTPGVYSRAVVEALKALMGEAQLSGSSLAKKTGKSNNYVATRMRNEKSFTLHDIADIGKVMGFDPAAFLGAVKVVETTGRVTYLFQGIDLTTVPIDYLLGAASRMADTEHLAGKHEK
jgi:transcriptional regulator with XRE-family HTH domain